MFNIYIFCFTDKLYIKPALYKKIIMNVNIVDIIKY